LTDVFIVLLIFPYLSLRFFLCKIRITAIAIKAMATPINTEHVQKIGSVKETTESAMAFFLI